MNSSVYHELIFMLRNNLKLFFNLLIFLPLVTCKQAPKPIVDPDELVIRSYPLTIACDTVDFTHQKSYSGKFSIISADQEILLATLDTCRQCFHKSLLIPCQNKLRTIIYQRHDKSILELEFDEFPTITVQGVEIQLTNENRRVILFDKLSFE